MTIDPRHEPVNNASIAIAREIIEAAREYDLTDAEILSILAERQQAVLKSMLRTERERAGRRRKAKR